LWKSHRMPKRAALCISLDWLKMIKYKNGREKKNIQKWYREIIRFSLIMK